MTIRPTIIVGEMSPEEYQMNADWTKQTWDLPPYKSEEFFATLHGLGWTLEKFKTLPIYRFAVAKGLIVNDEWNHDHEDAKRTDIE